MKCDLYKENKEEYVAPKSPTIVKVGPARYLSVRGRGEPGGPLFQAMVGALYTAVYTIKMAKKAAGRDFRAGYLEALTWLDPEYPCFDSAAKSACNWQLLIRVPSYVTRRDLERAIEAKRERAPEIAEVRLETLKEGQSVQMLHVGPYEEETRTVQAMLAYAATRGMQPHGYHHEIYLSDPRRVPAERLKTILRYPLQAARAARV